MTNHCLHARLGYTLERVGIALSRLLHLAVVVADKDMDALYFRFHKVCSDLVRQLNKNKGFIKDEVHPMYRNPNLVCGRSPQ